MDLVGWRGLKRAEVGGHQSILSWQTLCHQEATLMNSASPKQFKKVVKATTLGLRAPAAILTL